MDELLKRGNELAGAAAAGQVFLYLFEMIRTLITAISTFCDG